jgi:lipopolysaccharide export system permease protein
VAILCFAVFYNLTTMAKKWVEQQVLGPFPGLWWPHFLMAGLIAALFFGPALGRRWRAS